MNVKPMNQPIYFIRYWFVSLHKTAFIFRETQNFRLVESSAQTFGKHDQGQFQPKSDSKKNGRSPGFFGRCCDQIKKSCVQSFISQTHKIQLNLVENAVTPISKDDKI